MPPVSDREAQKLQPLNPAILADQVTEILGRKCSKNEKNEHLLQLAVRLVNGAGAVFFAIEEDKLKQNTTLISKQASSWSEDIAAEFTSSAVHALKQGRAHIAPLANESTVSIFSCPVLPRKEFQGCCLSVLVLLGESPPESFLVILELMAVAFAQVTMGQSASQSAFFEESGLLHLLFQNRENQNLDLRTISDVLRNWSGCSLLAISSINDNGKLRLRYVSDMVKIDTRTRKSRQFLKVMQECQQQKQAMLWPGKANDERFEQSLLLKELVGSQTMQQGATLFLPGVGTGGTVLMFLWAKQEDRAKYLSQFEYAASLLGPAFQSILSQGRRPSEQNSEALSGKKKKFLTALLLMSLVVICFIPKTYHLHPGSLVKPVQIRYVTARFDGILKQVFAEPGDRVRQNAPLALLDGREIELELRSLDADSAKALKMRDNYLVTGDVAQAQIARLEADRLLERSRLLRERQQQLDLQSPLDGIVLSGDLQQEVGGPVRRGQLLFEIAPLETILVELAVLDEDISYVKKGMNVTVRFDAFPGRKWQAAIERVAPRSEIIQGENVFPVMLTLENTDRVLQPGMQGNAAVDCGKKSLAWIYFHKPWYAVCQLFSSLF